MNLALSTAGIVSKRTDSLYRSGRTTKCLKIKAAGYQRRHDVPMATCR